MENSKLEDLIVKVLENQTKMQMDIDSIKSTVMNIEQDHGKKLEALFDGYKQNSDQLTSIQNEVSRHEEVILKRVK